ncbi:hypothetical protein Tco_0030523 [Tanacetum coccineum]
MSKAVNLPGRKFHQAGKVLLLYREIKVYLLTVNDEWLVQLNQLGFPVAQHGLYSFGNGEPPGGPVHCFQTQYFFNKDLEYLVSGDKGRRSALSISKLKVAQYLDFGLEELIRNIVIRKRVEDLQLGIESYQTKLNLTQPYWDASNFLFKEDYTIVRKPRSVIYRDRNDQKKMMRESEVHKFNDGILNRILDKLDHMIKDFKLFKYNPGMETRIWSKDDRRRSKDFMEVIERRLKIRRIFRSLESFVGGRL